MLKRRWPVLLGPPLLLPAVALVLLAAVLAVGAIRSPARAARLAGLGPLRACATAAEVKVGQPRPGTWWKTTDQLDASGTMVGRSLYVGHGPSADAGLRLPVESAVSGPIDGLLVVTADDGAHSQIRIISAVARCDLVIDDRADVVRSVLLDPHDGSVFAHLVARDTRADLGTVRISLPSDGATEARLAAPPLPPNLAAAVGTVYGTGLRLDRAGTHLAVQSCTDLGCLTRVFDLTNPSTSPRVLRAVDQGPMLGFAGADLVTWQACVGYPCPVLAWDVRTDRSRTLSSGATTASLTADGRRLVVTQAGQAGQAPAEVDTATGRATRLNGLAAGSAPLAIGPNQTIGLEVADDEIAIAIRGGDPVALRPDAAAEEALP